MSTPYEKTFEVSASSGEENHFELDFPHRGSLNKLVATQVSGVLGGFSLDLFNSARPKSEHESSVSFGSEGETVDRSQFQVLPTQEAAAADDRIEIFENPGYAYRNRDGSYSVPQRKLYLMLRPAGSGEKSFQITLGVVPPL